MPFGAKWFDQICPFSTRTGIYGTTETYVNRKIIPKILGYFTVAEVCYPFSLQITKNPAKTDVKPPKK
jgi:hypothetical protein